MVTVVSCDGSVIVTANVRVDKRADATREIKIDVDFIEGGR